MRVLLLTTATPNLVRQLCLLRNALAPAAGSAEHFWSRTRARGCGAPDRGGFSTSLKPGQGLWCGVSSCGYHKDLRTKDYLTTPEKNLRNSSCGYHKDLRTKDYHTTQERNLWNSNRKNIRG